MPRLPHRLSLLAALAAALALAACGSSSSGDGGGSAGDEEEQQLAFVDCLRSRGLDIRASPDGRGGLMMSSRAAAADGANRQEQRSMGPNDEAFRECSEQTGWAPRPPSEEQQAEMRDRALRFAQCMREHGVDMEDPGGEGGRILMRVRADTPGFRSAAEACGGGMFARPAVPPAGAE